MYLHIYIFIYLYIYLCIYNFIYVCIYFLIPVYVSMFFYLFIYLRLYFIHFSIYLFTYVFIHEYIYLFIYVFIYLCYIMCWLVGCIAGGDAQGWKSSMITEDKNGCKQFEMRMESSPTACIRHDWLPGNLHSQQEFAAITWGASKNNQIDFPSDFHWFAAKKSRQIEAAIWDPAFRSL